MLEGLMWSVQPPATAILTSEGSWQDVKDTSVVVPLNNEAVVMISYSLVALSSKKFHAGGDFINDNQKNSGAKDFIGCRLTVDGYTVPTIWLPHQPRGVIRIKHRNSRWLLARGTRPRESYNNITVAQVGIFREILVQQTKLWRWACQRKKYHSYCPPQVVEKSMTL